MNRLYNMTQADRWKLIFLLSTILIIFIGTGLMERYKLSRIHSDFSSIYSDRLIPATDIYYISDNLYEKRLSLDVFVSGSPSTGYEENIARRNISIDSLLAGYEKTYLVKDELLYLNDFKKRLAVYGSIESRVLALAKNGRYDEARDLFGARGHEEFDAVISDLHQLAAIQSAVGKQLIINSNAEFASTNLLSYLRFATSIVIGLIIMMLMQASRVVNQPNQKFNLN